jgi:hypothetical protein
VVELGQPAELRKGPPHPVVLHALESPELPRDGQGHNEHGGEEDVDAGHEQHHLVHKTLHAVRPVRRRAPPQESLRPLGELVDDGSPRQEREDADHVPNDRVPVDELRLNACETVGWSMSMGGG